MPEDCKGPLGLQGFVQNTPGLFSSSCNWEPQVGPKINLVGDTRNRVEGRHTPHNQAKWETLLC